jgi:glycopeptide antibiotics resistance protein
LRLLEGVLSKRKAIWWVLFVAYCGVVLWYTLLDRTVTTSRCELRPFWALQELAAGESEGVQDIVLYLENIILFVPFGFLLSVKVKGWKVVLIGTGVSFLIELIQYVTGRGLAEIDDLTANTIGAALGFLLWMVVRNHRH